MKGMQKMISLWLALCLVISMVPVPTFAEETAAETAVTETTVAAAETTLPTEAAEETTAPTEMTEEITVPIETEKETTATEEPTVPETEPLIVTDEAVGAEVTTNGTCGENLTWALENGVLTISGSGAMNDYRTPATVSNLKVAPWYNMRDIIQRIIIKEGVTTIGSCAFNSCMNVTEVILAAELTGIGNSSFTNCEALTEVLIPQGITYIGSQAFYSCDSLRHITIQGNVDIIDSNAFSKCTDLRNVIIEGSIKTVGSGAFDGCEKITRICLPEGLEIIETNAFSGCEALSTVVLPLSLKEIQYSAFSCYEDVDSVHYAGTEEQWSNIELASGNTCLSRAMFYFNSDGSTEVTFAGGSGLEEDPYQVATAEQLNEVRYHRKAHYVQIANIDLNKLEWVPIGFRRTEGTNVGEEDIATFTGSYDGQNYTISNMRITEISDRHKSVGLFGYNKGNLSNITLVNSEMLLSFSDDTFSNISTGSGYYPYPCIGGIVGHNKGTVSDCKNSGQITVNSCVDTDIYVGGIVGLGACNGCKNEADIIVSSESIPNDRISLICGGIVGHPGSINGEISNCVNYGDLYATMGSYEDSPGNDVYCGGITGQFGSLINCVNFGDITGVINTDDEKFYSPAACVGGLCGHNYYDSGKAVNCINFGNIAAHKNEEKMSCYAGGLFGYFTGETSNCYNLGTKIWADFQSFEYANGEIAEGDAGAIAGRSNGSCANCFTIDTVVVGEKPLGESTEQGTALPPKQIYAAIADILESLGLSEIVDEEKQGYSAQIDGWSFVNNGEKGFGYPSGYHIPEERYETVFGPAYTAVAKASEKNTFESMIPSSWGGNCYGMSATSILFYLDMLDWEEYGGSEFETVNNYYTKMNLDTNNSENHIYTISEPNSMITNLIECYQILQKNDTSGYRMMDSTYSLLENYVEDGITESGWWLWKNKSLKHDPNGTYIDSVLVRINEATEPLMVGMHGYYETTRKAVGHAVVVRTDKKPEPDPDKDGWYRVYIYDPNVPYMSEDLISQYGHEPKSYYLNHLDEDHYIELNPSKNLWRYNGDVNGSNSKYYWGCDQTEDVEYLKDTSYETDDGVTVIADYPDYMYVFSISDVGYPTSFNGTEPWLSRWKDKLNIRTTSNSNMIILDKDGNEICEVINGIPVVSVGGMDFQNHAGITQDGESSSYGTLTIPYTDITIEYMGGDDISIIGNDAVVNIASTGNVSVDISINNGKVSLNSTDSSEIIMQVSDVYSNSEYTSVVADGTLDAGDTVTIQLKNDDFSAEFDGTGSLELTTDNEEAPESRVIGTLNEDNPKEDIDDVREQTPPSVPMHRMYDPNSGEHFYSGSELERDFLVEAGWHYEGVGFNFPEEGAPVHRLYDPVHGEHLYTMDEAEMNELLDQGWNYEGVAFNSAGNDEVPQYRLHNPNAKRGGYHFTGSEVERDLLISYGWILQGIGWYSCLE